MLKTRNVLLVGLLLLNLFQFGWILFSDNSSEVEVSSNDVNKLSSPTEKNPKKSRTINPIVHQKSGIGDPPVYQFTPVSTEKTKSTNKKLTTVEEFFDKGDSSPEQSVAEENVFKSLLAQVREAENLGDYERSWNILKMLKEQSVGEDLQTVLKKIADYGEEGGQEILASFFGNPNLPERERFRMLSYIDDEYQLSNDDVGGLQSSYEQVESPELRSTIIDTIARSGGYDEVNWLIGKVENAEYYSEWSVLLNSLSQTKSETALQYLHGYLNDLAINASPEDEIYRQNLREAIKAF